MPPDVAEEVITQLKWERGTDMDLAITDNNSTTKRPKLLFHLGNYTRHI